MYEVYEARAIFSNTYEHLIVITTPGSQTGCGIAMHKLTQANGNTAFPFVPFVMNNKTRTCRIVNDSPKDIIVLML